MELNKEAPPSDAATADPVEPVPTNCWHRFVNFWRTITVEPVVVCFIVGLYLMSLTDQNMYLEKACLVNRNYPADVCDKIIQRDVDDIETEDRETEAAYNAVQIWSRPLASWLSVCLVMFWGAWSDRSGRRKPCLYFPLLAQLIISLTNMLSGTVFVRTPLEVPMFSNAIVDGLSGGPGTLLVGVYSYLADVTPPAQLSYRVGMTSWCLTVGNICGVAVSGIAVRVLGYRSVYLLSASLFAGALVYTWFCIEESSNGRGGGDSSTPAVTAAAADETAPTTQTQEPAAATTVKKEVSLLRQFFDLDHVVQTCRVVTRSDPLNPNRRPVIVLLLVIWFLVAGPLQGEGTLLYLFSRLHFNWTELELSAFSTFNSVTSLIGNTFIVNVLSGRLAASDSTIAIVGLCSKMLANCVYAAALVAWVFFAGSVLEMLSAGINIAMRSIASKAVGTDEVGKMNAILALTESGVPLIFTPLYVTVYDATRDYWPSAFLALGIVLLLPALPVFIWIGRFVKNAPSPDAAAERNSTDAALELAVAHDNKTFQPDADDPVTTTTPGNIQQRRPDVAESTAL